MKTPNEKNKNCFWRHGAYKTIKIQEYGMDSTKSGHSTYGKAYKTKRFIVFQRCGFCGKVIMHLSTHDGVKG